MTPVSEVPRRKGNVGEWVARSGWWWSHSSLFATAHRNPAQSLMINGWAGFVFFSLLFLSNATNDV